LEEHVAAPKRPSTWWVIGRAVARDREEVLAGALDALLDRDGDLVRLA